MCSWMKYVQGKQDRKKEPFLNSVTAQDFSPSGICLLDMHKINTSSSETG